MRVEYVDTACDMAPNQKVEYERFQGTLDAACKELLRLGSMKLFGTYLSTIPTGLSAGISTTAKSPRRSRLMSPSSVGPRDPLPPRVEPTVDYWNCPGVKTVD